MPRAPTLPSEPSSAAWGPPLLASRPLPVSFCAVHSGTPYTAINFFLAPARTPPPKPLAPALSAVPHLPGRVIEPSTTPHAHLPPIPIPVLPCPAPESRFSLDTSLIGGFQHPSLALCCQFRTRGTLQLRNRMNEGGRAVFFGPSIINRRLHAQAYRGPRRPSWPGPPPHHPRELCTIAKAQEQPVLSTVLSDIAPSAALPADQMMACSREGHLFAARPRRSMDGRD